jgi:pimeloyl-ACP methyl ester carboxylesterase
MTDQEFVAMQKSTAVRSREAPWPIRVLRPAAATLSAVAPTLAARVAERMFLAPPRYPQPAHEAAALASARSTVVETGTPITTWTWGHGPAILLVHGWGGRGGQLAGVVPRLVANGYSVIAFDAPGHGQSPAMESSLVAFVAAIHAVSRALGPVHAVIAHSIGAAAAACALRDGLRADAAVFLAPPSDLTLHADIMVEALGFGRRARELMRERIERRLGVPWSALDLSGFAAQMRTPLLVIHDRDDAEVPWQEGAMIAQAWPGARLSTTSGLGHRRLVRDRDVVGEAVDFVLDELRWRRPVRTPAPPPVMASLLA